jgi:Arc/MetJ family transcription regulator
MAVTQVDIDQDALDRVMALSKATTKEDAVNLALRYTRTSNSEPHASASTSSARTAGEH